MNFSLLNRYPIIKKWVLSHIGYFADIMYLFRGEELIKASSNDAFIVIVAKCHYVESWQSFAAVNKKDLQKIIKLKNSRQAKQIFQLFENKSIDGFDVKTTTFNELLVAQLGDNKILIPETELFSKTDTNQHIYQIETISGLLFCGGHAIKNMSSYAKGMLRDIETYKLSVGLPDDTEVTFIAQDDFAHFLIDQLFSQQINQTVGKILAKPSAWFELKQLHSLYWAPLITTLVFFTLSNGYLFIKTNSLENELARGGKEVGSVLNQKQDYDNKMTRLATLSNEFNERKLVHYYWNIIHQLVEKEMTITRISYSKGKLVIRGLADKASDVLSAIAEHPQIESASFQGPVRKSRGQDSFILEVAPSLSIPGKENLKGDDPVTGKEGDV